MPRLTKKLIAQREKERQKELAHEYEYTGDETEGIGFEEDEPKGFNWTRVLTSIVIGTSTFWFYASFLYPPEVPRLPTVPYLDMHVHTAGMGYGNSGIYLNPKLRDNYRKWFYLAFFNVSEGELEEYGDEYAVLEIANRIDKSDFVNGAVVLAMDGVIDANGELDYDSTEIYVPNEFVRDTTRKYPSLFFGASVNPYRPDALERVEQAKADGAVLIKWIPNIMAIDPSDERIDEFYETLVRLDLPLLTHTGAEASFQSTDDRLGDPQLLHRPLQAGVTVIASHLASEGEVDGQPYFERLKPMFRQYENLYADISALTQFNKRNYLRSALEDGTFTDRLIYGSDYPLPQFPLVSPLYHLDVIGIRGAYTVMFGPEGIWDSNVVLKKEMGVPHHVFERSAKLLNVQVPKR